MSKITLDNISENLKNYIDSKSGVSDEEVINIVETNITGDKTQLLTNNKSSLVDAINEVFQSGNNVKQNLVDALIAKGFNVSTSNSFSELIAYIYLLTLQGTTGSEDAVDVEYNTWATCSPMAVERYGLCTEAIGTNIYAIGGYNSTYSSVNECYDTLTNTWTTKTRIPQAIAYSTSGVIGDEIYMVSGMNTEGGVTTFYKYNPSTNTWTSNLNSPLLSLVQMASAVVDNGFYIFGGSDGALGSTGTYYYSKSTDTWTDMATMNYGRWGLCAERADNTIYAFGGKSGDTMYNTIERYTPEGNSWTLTTQIPDYPFESSSAVIANNIYIMGGCTESNTASYTNMKFDVYANEWTTDLAPLPTKRYLASAVAVNGKIYNIGGTSNGSTALNLVEVYGAVEGSSSSSSSNIICTTELPETVVNNQIVIITDTEPTVIKIKDSLSCAPSIDTELNIGYITTNNDRPYYITQDGVVTTLYLDSALQYTNSSTKRLYGYIGINDEWKLFSVTEFILYDGSNNGGAKVDFEILDTNGTVTLLDDGIKIDIDDVVSAGSAYRKNAVRTVDTFTITPYSKLTINFWEGCGATSNGDCVVCRIYKEDGTLLKSADMHWTSISGGGDYTIEIDISNINQNKVYILFYINISGGNKYGSFYIEDIIFE